MATHSSGVGWNLPDDGIDRAELTNRSKQRPFHCFPSAAEEMSGPRDRRVLSLLAAFAAGDLRAGIPRTQNLSAWPGSTSSETSGR